MPGRRESPTAREWLAEFPDGRRLRFTFGVPADEERACGMARAVLGCRTLPPGTIVRRSPLAEMKR